MCLTEAAGGSSALGRRFEGKVAIVTGASRGIGLAIANRLIAEGARVCITGRHADALREAASTLPGDGVVTVAGNADNSTHRQAVLDTVASTYGRLDVLVNNVGINPVYGRLDEIELSMARKILDVNVVSTLAWVRTGVAHGRLRLGEGGAVVNVSSVTGHAPSPGIGMYGISKAAVSHLTRTLAVELAPGVRVNAVAPAVVKTQFARALYEGKEEAVTATYPLGRLGTPEDVAAAVGYLASDDAAWVTGQTLTLDGGLLSAGGTA